MFLENKTTLFFLFLLALGSSVELYFLNTQSQKTEKDYGHYPDSVGYNLISHRFDEAGFLSTEITAQKSIHYPDTKTTFFNTIVMTVFSQQNFMPWVIHAPSAIAYGRGDTIDVQGKIHMQREAFADHPLTQVDTSDVTIFSDKKLLATKAEVISQQPGVYLRGVGATFDYDKNVLNLLGQVQTYYVPTKKT